MSISLPVELVSSSHSLLCAFLAVFSVPVSRGAQVWSGLKVPMTPSQPKAACHGDRVISRKREREREKFIDNQEVTEGR